MSSPRYLWPDDHQRNRLPFRDGEVVEAARHAIDHVAHLPFPEALRQLLAEAEARDAAERNQTEA